MRVAKWILAVAFVAAFLVGSVFFWKAIWRQGEHTRRSKAQCHALGPEYHYWQARSRCVRYVGP